MESLVVVFMGGLVIGAIIGALAVFLASNLGPAKDDPAKTLSQGANAPMLEPFYPDDAGLAEHLRAKRSPGPYAGMKP